MGSSSMKASILQNIRTFFGEKQNDKDAEKYARVLENLYFPEMDDCDTESLCRMAQDALEERPPASGRQEHPFCLAVTKLGREKRKGGLSPDAEPQLQRLAVRMAYMLAAYEEDIALHMFRDDTVPGSGRPASLSPVRKQAALRLRR